MQYILLLILLHHLFVSSHSEDYIFSLHSLQSQLLTQLSNTILYSPCTIFFILCFLRLFDRFCSCRWASVSLLAFKFSVYEFSITVFLLTLTFRLLHPSTIHIAFDTIPLFDFVFLALLTSLDFFSIPFDVILVFLFNSFVLFSFFSLALFNIHSVCHHPWGVMYTFIESFSLK